MGNNYNRSTIGFMEITEELPFGSLAVIVKSRDLCNLYKNDLVHNDLIIYS